MEKRKSRRNDQLIWKMAVNDMKSRYASSVLGLIWIFVIPLITIGVFWVVYQMGFRNKPISDAPFILWFVCAYVPWLFFSDFLMMGTNCLTEYSYLVKKMKFQVEILPVIKLISSFMVHVFFLIVLFAMFLVYGVPLTVYCVQVIYYSFAMMMFTLGLVWIFSATCAFFKDILQIVNVIIQIGFWTTPIIWNLKEMGSLIRTILSYNPMSYIVEGYRDGMIYHQWFWEKPIDTIYFWCITIAILVIGRIIFERLRPYFADEI